MTATESTPYYTRQFWAKAQPYRQRGPERIHLLEHHLADVGACFEELLAQPTIRKRLAESGGMDSLDDATAARLALFAALHDIGKVNVGFQTQIWRDEDFPAGQRSPGYAGHYHELAPVLMGEDGATADWFFNDLGWWQDATRSWDDCGGKTVCALFIAALSHHGQPCSWRGVLTPTPLWESYGSLVPAEGVRRIGALARQPLQMEGRLNSNSALWESYGSLVPAEGVRRIGALARMVPCRFRHRAAVAIGPGVPAHVPGPLHSGRLDRLQGRMVPLLR